MQQARAIEISTGLFVFLGFGALFFMASQIASREFSIGSESFRVTAEFNNIGGLKVGAPVSMSGVTVGRVEAIDFDQKLYKAVVRMRINKRYDRIPTDSDASIYTSGLLGGQYVGISAGGLDEYLHDGDQIEFVQDALVLENLISKFLVNMAGSKKDDGGSARGEEDAQ
jgi:phospholipid/cholesterol/gamma-HCH transport system substrate-binding protein